MEENPNIREYNFAVPGNIDRHIPGIPGIWPFGSRVQVDEETNQVVKVIVGSAEGLQLVIPGPVEARAFTGFNANGDAVSDTLVVPVSPPALDNQPVEPEQPASEQFVSHMQ